MKIGNLARWAVRTVLTLVCLLLVCGVVLAVLWHTYPFPIERLERWPASPRVTDRHGAPLLTRVSADEQWRFPVGLDEMSPWLIQATIAAEDKRFRRHVGVDLLAAIRAAGQNVSAGRTVSGASTLTMQLARMMDDRPRTLSAKLIESFRALQLERIRSKDEILACYLNVAPYGRNLRGVEAASLAYFGKRAKDLSLDEAALLAGVPQSPSRLGPDRFPDAARARRELVLARMAGLGMINADQRRRAAEEPVAISPRGRPRLATHAAFLALQLRPGGGRTTIDAGVQEEVERLAADHRAQKLPAGSDLAVVVIDIARGEIVAMVGSADADDPLDGQVNGALAWRSPGSALKPFIYAAAFEAGRLAPDSTVYDVPIHRAGWSPQNFEKSFVGELPAGEALQRSLNVPAILVAEGVGINRCVGLMEAAGVTFRPGRSPASRGGLAVAVGAVEVRLLDLTNAYATLGAGGVRRPVRLFLDEAETNGDGERGLQSPDQAIGASTGYRRTGGPDTGRPSTTSPSHGPRVLDANICAAIDEVLSTRQRARRPSGLEALAPADVPWFMWKTGTSSARRDAWALGHNRRFAIGVWVGRFSGAARPDYVGSQAAEPLLAQLFLLPELRSGADPPPPRPWRVANPLARPADLAGPLRVLAPCDGATFLAVGGTTVIRPVTNARGEPVWFLNGVLLTRSPPRPGFAHGKTAAAPSRGLAWPLVLSPGSYRLRCVDAAGDSSEVGFTVR